MTARLAELLSMRAALDVEIAAERAAMARAAALLRRGHVAITRGTWETRIFVATCGYFEVDGDEVLETSRRGRVGDARHVAMWLLRQIGRSYSEIARQFERRDHTSVMNGCRRVEGNPELVAAGIEIYKALTGEVLALPDPDERAAS